MPDQSFTTGGQDFKTAGMCLVKTRGCLGSWKPPQGNSVGTTAFHQLRVLSLKIDLSDTHAFRIIWERMLLNATTICPTGQIRERKEGVLALPFWSGGTAQRYIRNPIWLSWEGLKLPSVLYFLYFSDFRKSVINVHSLWVKVFSRSV